MDASHLDDKMDVASSPFRQVDDIDIELDSVREPSVIGSVQDEMIDDTVVAADAASDVMQDEFDEALADDDMFDDTRQDQSEQQDIDYNMDGSIEVVQHDEDEDILYEDEDDIRAGPPQNDGIVEYNSNETSPGYLEVAAEVILEDLDHQIEPTEEHDFLTNESENLPVSDDTITGDQLADNLDQDQSLNVPQEYLGEPSDGQDHQQHDPLPQSQEDPKQVEPLQQQTERQDILEEPHETQATIHPGESLVSADAGEPGQEHHEEPAKSNAETSTPKTMHPITLYYLEEEMSLFPPMLGDTSSVYFLSDSSLAFEPLDKLLAACREILVGTLDHHDELVLDVPGLGLHICEDSKYAAQLTLAQVVDVYLRLCHNDEHQEAQPLYCNLSSRVSLASQYAYLAAASGEGKTYAEIAADHADSPELQDEDTAVASQKQAVSSNQSATDADPLVATDQPGNISSTDIAENSDKPDVFDLEDQAQKDAAAQITATTENAPPPDTDNSETFAGTDESEQPDPHEDGNPHDGEREDGNPHDGEREDGYGELPIPESAGDEPKQGPGDTDHSYEDREDETNSSHTVDGDPADASLQAASVDSPGADIFDSGPGDAQQEDIFPPEDDIVEPDYGYAAYDDEELFPAKPGDEETREGDVTADIPADDQSATLQDLAPQDPPEDVVSFTTLDESHGQEKPRSASPAGIPTLDNLSPPVTPKQVKRKAEDADDLLFLDLDTPDPKRPRSS
ncbi:hypothetical protein A1O7_02536 [Cladophialophora yegresii CBS 114405]|uniref:Uncharacterized protein n=1 Tax=Cladophialophora yegresii CBS 114405 TaxID=1182544 RepID=W9W2C7_9EURO|nr:uncharacterized protein A1O7_02536 [Cladophialophora yegresii CBS 114405]EXJ62103.1 hypothetical protein A1O7_02536 [Cladophialophora yegresii CBS 114405]